MSTLLAIAGAVLTAVVLYWLYPDASVRWMRRVSAAKEVVLGLIGLAVALVFVGSGSPLLMAVGFASLVLSALWLLADKPWQAVLEVLGLA